MPQRRVRTTGGDDGRFAGRGRLSANDNGSTALSLTGLTTGRSAALLRLRFLDIKR